MQKLNLFAAWQAVTSDQITSPTRKFKDGDNLVGVLDPELQKLCSLYFTHVKKYNVAIEEATKLIETMGEEHGKLHDAGEVTTSCCLEHAAKIAKLAEPLDNEGRMLKQLGEIFWGAVRLEFPEIARKPELAICEGFKVVWVKNPESENLTSLLERLAGFFDFRS